MQDGVGRIGTIEVEFCRKKDFIEFLKIMKVDILLNGDGKARMTGIILVKHIHCGELED